MDQAQVVDSYEEHVNAHIAKEIENKQHPQAEKDMPWA